MLFGATTASAEDAVDLGLPPTRRMSSSADGPLRNGRRRERGGSMSAAGSVPEPTVLAGESKVATLRIEAPESARKAVTTIGADPRHPLADGLEVDLDGDLSLGRGMMQVTWRPKAAGKFRGNLAFKVDGRFPAQVSVVGEAVGVGDGGKGGGGGGKKRKGEHREARARMKGVPTGVGGGATGRRRSSSQEASSRGGGPYASMYGKENRLSLSSTSLPPAASILGSSSVPSTAAASALSQGTANKRQQMLKYSKSRRLSLKPSKKRGKSENGSGGEEASVGGSSSKAALLRKSLSDKGWAEKQTAGFTNWLNFTLFARIGGRRGSCLWLRGWDSRLLPLSPRMVCVVARHEARQRMRAMRLFRSAELRVLTEAVAERAHDGTISLRRDRVLHADVGLSGALVDLVLCYEPRWLMLGLETVFGEIGGGGGRAVERALRTFVSERLVKCPEIKARYGFRGRVASGLSELDYNDDLARHTLTHFLDLVLFLDRAKAENLLHPCPCLFRKTAEVKSSVGALRVFCQFLHGEGDFVRHLKKMGYVVTHVQSYIDEFDFHVSNLAIDLRDGVRLTRLMEVVTKEWGLAAGLRVPAVSRLQAIFNTRKALEHLERKAGPITLGNGGSGDAGTVTPKDVVDGDRHATLRLLWFIIARYALSALLDRDALAREAEGVVSAARKWRRAGFSPARPERALSRKTRAMSASTGTLRSSSRTSTPCGRGRGRGAAGGVAGVVPGGVPWLRCPRAELHDVVCGRAGALPAAALLPSEDHPAQRHPPDHCAPSDDRRQPGRAGGLVCLSRRLKGDGGAVQGGARRGAGERRSREALCRGAGRRALDAGAFRQHQPPGGK
ncbi:unnamed protein product, partial [Scytosiphon promiscuus]